MEIVIPILVGILFTAGIFMMLSPYLMRNALGIILLTNACNLFLFSAGRVSKKSPPIIPQPYEKLTQDFTNPVSQALILTAIVIGFAILSFVLALIYRSYLEFDTQQTSQIGKEE